MKTLFMFDLDATVIDSSKRLKKAMLPNGDLCLNKYRETQNKIDIMTDTLLPLADYMRHLIAEGERVAIVTARALTKSDYYFLRKHGLKCATICSRDQLPRYFDDPRAIWRKGDAEYKAAWFKWLAGRYPESKMILWDDHKGVLSTARAFGIRAIDAVALNEILGYFLDVGYSMGYTDGLDDRIMASAMAVYDFDEMEKVA